MLNKFEQQDKRDTYLNGYKVDEDSSPVASPPSLQLVREQTTISYNVFNDPFTMRSMQNM